MQGIIHSRRLSEVGKQFVHWYHQQQQDLLCEGLVKMILVDQIEDNKELAEKRMMNWFLVDLPDDCIRVLCPYFGVLLISNESKLHLLLR